MAVLSQQGLNDDCPRITPGFLAIEAAYLLQACKVTWELFLYPIIAPHSASAFLHNDAVILHDPGVAAFGAISSLAIFAGIVLFCFALYRSDAYPKAAAVLLFAGALMYALGPMISLYFGLFELTWTPTLRDSSIRAKRSVRMGVRVTASG
jgi:hypothetical protein